MKPSLTATSLIALFAMGLSLQAAAELELSYTDDAWGGDSIPEGQQCNRFEGDNPQSPELVVKNIPAGATAIVLEFSDRTMKPMDKGGHGKVGYKVSEGTTEVTIPRIPGHTEDLPDNFFTVEPHRAPGWDTAGAYLPPCSGGRGNEYFIDVKAVELGDGMDVSTVLEEGSIKLAVF